MDQNDLERLLQVLSSKAQGIESSTTKEQISGSVEETLIEITKTMGLTPDNAIQEKTVFKVPVYICGCLSQGRANAGTKCSKCKKTSCLAHSYRCGRCLKPLCINCRRQLYWTTLCHHCLVFLFFFRFLRQKYLRNDEMLPNVETLPETNNSFENEDTYGTDER